MTDENFIICDTIRFPLEDPNLLSKWLANISLENFKPTVNHSVCSDHFMKDDYIRGKLLTECKALSHRYCSGTICGERVGGRGS